MDSFPIKLHCLLDNAEQEGYAHCARWNEDGKSFRIDDHRDSSEGRQDHKIQVVPSPTPALWYVLTPDDFLIADKGFTRITKGPLKGQCSHPQFTRDNKMGCLRMMRRRKQAQNNGLQGSVSAPSGLWAHKGGISRLSSMNSASTRNSSFAISSRSSFQNQSFTPSSSSGGSGRNSNAFRNHLNASMLLSMDNMGSMQNQEQAIEMGRALLEEFKGRSSTEPLSVPSSGSMVNSSSQPVRRSSAPPTLDSEKLRDLSKLIKDESEEEEDIFGGQTFFTIETGEEVTLF